MTKYSMMLKDRPFKDLYYGRKTAEVRLLKDMRNHMNVGKGITFFNMDRSDILVDATITSMCVMHDIEELEELIPVQKFGSVSYEQIETEMYEYSSNTEVKEQAMLVIEFEPVRKSECDFYLVESSLENISSQLKTADIKLGQLTFEFQAWLNKQNYNMWSLNNDEFLALLKKYMGEPHLWF